MNSRSYIILGTFVLVCLAGLLWAAIELGGLNLGGRDEHVVLFGKDALIEEGLEVLTAGTKVGFVTEVELIPDREIEPDKYVRAVIALQKGLTLWEGAEVLIVPRSVLGGHLIQLERGDPAKAKLPDGTVLRGRMQDGLMDSLTRIAEEDLKGLAADLGALAKGVREGKGTMGKLFTEAKLYNDLARAVEDAQEIIEGIKSGEGALGALLQDKSLKRDLETIVANVKSITANLEGTESALGKLMNDPDMGKEVETLLGSARSIAVRMDEKGILEAVLQDEALTDVVVAIKNFREFSDELRASEGTIQMLMRNPDLYVKLNDAAGKIDTVAGNLVDVSDGIRSGRGTLGKLLVDESLYDEAKLMLGSFREGAEISRENAPLATVVTFSAFLFSVLN